MESQQVLNIITNNRVEMTFLRDGLNQSKSSVSKSIFHSQLLDSFAHLRANAVIKKRDFTDRPFRECDTFVLGLQVKEKIKPPCHQQFTAPCKTAVAAKKVPGPVCSNRLLAEKPAMIYILWLRPP